MAQPVSASRARLVMKPETIRMSGNMSGTSPPIGADGNIHSRKTGLRVELK